MNFTMTCRAETTSARTEVRLAHRILERVYQLRNLLPGVIDGAGELASRGLQLRKISRFIERDAPIHFILPAFPAKSPNPEKTLGHLPDYGEVIALRKLQRLCLDIEALYPRGARLTLCSDGRVFSDLVLVKDEHVGHYSTAIRAILRDEGLDRIETFCLDDEFPGLDYGAMRAALVEDFAEPLDRLQIRVKSEEAERQLFNGIHRFLFEDRAALFPGSSRNSVRVAAKRVAYEVIQRSHAWSSLVESRFPEAVRLSIHPQAPSSTKIGVSLVPCRDSWATPWHGVIVTDGNRCWLSRRKDAEALGASLVLAEGKYPHFQLPGGIA